MFERRNNIETPHTNTCHWIVQHKVYKQWKSGDNGILWIKGKPGAGKSTMMKFIHTLSEKEHLGSTKVNLDFFFNAQGVGLQRTFRGMMRSLLYQLFKKDSSTRSLIKASFEQKRATDALTKQEVQWQLQELKNLVVDVLASSAQQQIITIFIDAIDEAEREEFHDISQYFIEIDRRMCKEEAEVKICISCRHYPITDLVSGARINMEQCNAADIETYINDTLALESMGSSDYDAWQKLKEDLVARASGVFQWARLVVPMAKRKIGDGESPDEVREWIQEVPTELSEIYRHILSKVIESDKRPASFALLQWTTLAMRPLSLTELRFAMAAQKLAGGDVRNKCEEVIGFVNNNDRMKRLVTTLSGGLVETLHQDKWTVIQRLRQQDPNLDFLPIFDDFNDDKIVEPIHQTVAEFLKSDGLALSADLSTRVKSDAKVVVQQSHALLFKACLCYLATEDLHVEQDDYDERLLRKRLPFIAYAARNVFAHAQSSGSHYFPAVVPLISDLQRILPQWIKIYEMFNTFWNSVFHKGATLLHVASATNLTKILQMQLKDGVHVDSADEAGNTAIYYAARLGCVDSVKVLLEANAMVDARNHYGKTALVEAAGRGQIKRPS